MKILYVCSQNIFGNISCGGEQCARRNYELISDCVDNKGLFCCIIANSDDNTANTLFLRRAEKLREILFSTVLGCRLYVPTEEEKFLRFVNSINPDVIFFETSLFGRLIMKLKKYIRNKFRIILFLQNIEADYARHRVQHSGIQYLPILWATTYNERLALKYSDSVIVLNDRDANLVNALYHRKANYKLPISFRDIFDKNKLDKNNAEKTIIFVGSNFPPNYEGIKWFINEVMPHIPQYKLLIIGKGFEETKNELIRKNVEVIGTVCDVTYYYYHYSISVMPILYGDGMKVKTAEAMMYGMNIFATDEALRGYAVDKVPGIYRCNTASDFIDAISKHGAECTSKIINSEVRNCFKEHYDLEVQKKLMRDILNNNPSTIEQP